MSDVFDPRGRFVLATVTLVGPAGPYETAMAVDTGASRTSLSESVARRVGFDPRTLTRIVRSRGVHSDGTARVAVLSQLDALGRSVSGFEVRVIAFNPSVRVSGLLGLDFFRGHVLTLDFARGRIGLRPPRKWWHVW